MGTLADDSGATANAVMVSKLGEGERERCVWHIMAWAPERFSLFAAQEFWVFGKGVLAEDRRLSVR